MSYEEFSSSVEHEDSLVGKRLQGPIHSCADLQLFVPKAARVEQQEMVLNNKISNKMTVNQLLQSNPGQTIFSRNKVYKISVDSKEYFVSPSYTVRKYTDENSCDFWYAVDSETKMSGETGSVKKVALMDPSRSFSKQNFDYCLKEKTYKVVLSSANHNKFESAFTASCVYEDTVLHSLKQQKVEKIKNTPSGIVQKYRFISLWQQGTSLQALLAEKPFFLQNNINCLNSLLLSIAKMLTEINLTGAHLDIKPGNILVQSEKLSYIIDGDTYMKFDADIPETIRTTGAYAAPELKRGEISGKDIINFKKLDSFALGMTFLVILSFEENELKQIKDAAIKSWDSISLDQSLCDAIAIKEKILERFPVLATEETAEALSQIIEKLVRIKSENRITAEDAYIALQSINSMFACGEEHLPSSLNF